MNSIILAAGQAKRLQPITNSMPKCLLTVGGKTILDRQIQSLLNNNIDKIIIVVGFEADKIIGHINKFYDVGRFIFIHNMEYESTYPAYGLWLAKDFLVDGVLYLNADVLYDRQILNNIINDPRETVTAIQRVAWDEEEVNIIKGKNDKIIEIGKHVSKELSFGEFIGVTKMDKQFNAILIEALESFIEKKEYKKFAADAINLAIQRGGIMYLVDVSEYRAIEIDTPEDYEAAKSKVLEIFDN